MASPTKFVNLKEYKINTNLLPCKPITEQEFQDHASVGYTKVRSNFSI